MDITTIENAINEVEQIRARHDGVHQIHGIWPALHSYRDWVKQGRWEDVIDGHDFAADFEHMMKQARHIDRTGFPLRENRAPLPHEKPRPRGWS